MRLQVVRSLPCVELQRALLSVAFRLMIGLAVPERKKSASLTELMKASCTTASDGLMRFNLEPDIG